MKATEIFSRYPLRSLEIFKISLQLAFGRWHTHNRFKTMPIFDAFVCMPHQITSLVDGKPSKHMHFVVLFTILSLLLILRTALKQE